jgi:hypothetical protein
MTSSAIAMEMLLDLSLAMQSEQLFSIMNSRLHSNVAEDHSNVDSFGTLQTHLVW